jgi:hypothetical protein
MAHAVCTLDTDGYSDAECFVIIAFSLQLRLNERP